MRRRVVITGMGCITPLGHSVSELWGNILKGASGASPTELFDAGTFPSKFAAQVKNFRLTDHIPDPGIHRHAGRNSQFVLAAAEQAWKQSGMAAANADPRRVGVYLGSGEGSVDLDNFMSVMVDSWRAGEGGGEGTLDTVRWGRLAFERMNATREMEQEANMPASHVALRFNARGPNFNCLTACAASTQANGESTAAIRRGDVDVVISGGCHSMIHPFGVTGFNRLTALTQRNDSPATASRPFDRTRDGFLLGEGAGIVILEEYEHAKARGAAMLAEIIGYGSSADAYRITDIHPQGRGGAACMAYALADAGIGPDQIDYICAHGTSTKENDRTETLAIKTVFGEFARKVAVSSPKSMVGHLIAAAGTTELILCVMAIRESMLPPTQNLHTPDPECDLDYVPNQARPANVRTAMNNSFGFGGQNDCVIVRRME